MQLSFNLLTEKLEDLTKTFLALSNIKRLKLLLLLNKINSGSAAQIHKTAKREGIYSNRETTYRALEDLVKIKLVSKIYNEEKKELNYSIKHENNS